MDMTIILMAQRTALILNVLGRLVQRLPDSFVLQESQEACALMDLIMMLTD
jgi:hypothetical protein